VYSFAVELIDSRDLMYVSLHNYSYLYYIDCYVVLLAAAQHRTLAFNHTICLHSGDIDWDFLINNMYPQM